MSEYKHGTYGIFADSIGAVTTQSGTVAVYVGAAPVNLVRGYEKAVNTPIKLSNKPGARAAFGYSANWAAFDLCEAFKAHFDNTMGNIGPIVAINVLNPATHRKAGETTAALSFVNGRATIVSDTIILDTLKLEGKNEGTDYSVDYDFDRGTVIIQSIGEAAITGAVDATYNEVDPSAITAEDIIGTATAAGVYTGLGCVQLIYNALNIIPNMIVCPGWSHVPEVYNAMVSAGRKINGHWDAVIYADIPLVDGARKIDTRAAAKEWAKDKGYNAETSKIFWPKSEGTDGKVHHLSVYWAWRQMLVDATHGGVPVETASNKAVPVVAQYFGEGSLNRGFDQQQGNELNAAGITTVVFWGGQWVLWGPHTAAYKHGAVTDNRVIFDTSIRVMMYQVNSFQAEHALVIDSPMTRAMADTIRNREQEKADALAAIGALIGTPVVEFQEIDNPTGELVEGNFVWSSKGTPTPPFKSGTLKMAYTTEGFESFYGEVE